MSVVTHADPAASLLIEQHLEARAAGTSVLVRPQQAYEGLDRVIGHLRRLTMTPLRVTDLSGVGVTEQGRGDASQDHTHRAGALLAFHTSGSTGAPKCVVYDADTADEHASLIADVLELTSQGPSLALPPCHFAYGLSIVHSHSVAGAPVRFVPTATTTDLVRALRAHPDTEAVYLLPQQASQLLDVEVELPALRRLLVAGGLLSRASARALDGRFPAVELVNMYGQAELGPRLALWRGALTDYVEGTLGNPLPGVLLEAGDPDDQGRSELVASTPYAARHLLRSPYDVVEAGPVAPVPTGDLVRRGPASLLHVGRTGMFANVAGTKVDLEELRRLVESAQPVVASRITTRRSRVTGDDVVVVEVVPVGGTRTASWTARDLRDRLHPVLGGLTSLLDVRLVDHVSTSEAGK